MFSKRISLWDKSFEVTVLLSRPGLICAQHAASEKYGLFLLNQVKYTVLRS